MSIAKYFCLIHFSLSFIATGEKSFLRKKLKNTQNSADLKKTKQDLETYISQINSDLSS